MRVKRRWTTVAMLVTVLAAPDILIHRGAGAAPAGGVSSPSAAAPNDLQTVAPQPGRTSEQERDPGREPRPHEPVFIEPLATMTEHTRLGLSACIAPGAPFERRENPGGVAIGFTIAWPAAARDTGSPGPRP